MTISQRAVRGHRAPGIAGGLYDISALNDETYFVNAHPQAKQKSTIAVSSAAASATYKLNVNGAEINFTNPATGMTTTTAAAGIAAAINAEPMARGQVVATSSGATITLESTLPGLGFAASHSDAKLGAVTLVTAAAEAEAIGFGVLCIRGGKANTELYDNRHGRLASAAGLTQSEVTLDVAGTDVATVSVRVNGVNHTKVGAIAALRAALNGIDGLTVTGATTKVIIKADAGAEIELLGTSNATIDSQVAGDDINELAIGISRRTYDEEASYRTGLVGYPGNAGVSALRRGRIWIECSEDVAEGATVYAALTGDDAGKLFASPGAGRVALSRDRCKFFKSRAADGLAVVDCNFF